MVRTSFRRKEITEHLTTDEDRIRGIETDTKLLTPANRLIGFPANDSLHLILESTSFDKCVTNGDTRIVSLTAATTIDEETNAAVVAYAEFNDVGGNGAASVSPFDATATIVPLFDNEGRTAYYSGIVGSQAVTGGVYIAWDFLHPEVSGNTKKFMAGHSVKLNVTDAFQFPPQNPVSNSKSFVYYDSHANFNVSASISVALWFYPTNTSQIAAETYRVLFYRRIDASNSFMIMIKPSDQKVYVFVNEAAATTKLASAGTVNLNAWNLIIFTYNPATNALVIYLNNSSSSTTPADALPAPYSTDANMYLGGLPLLPDKRFSGYLETFVFWTAKILTGTEASNMWTRGTII